jgi:hypothetical protein
MCDICHMLGVTHVACQASRNPDAMLIVGADKNGAALHGTKVMGQRIFSRRRSQGMQFRLA